MENIKQEVPFAKIREKTEKLLEHSKNVYPPAILCDLSFGQEVCEELEQSKELQFKPILLNPTAEKHQLKRKLNENGCGLILYTKEFEPMIYEIFNDGTTLLEEALLIEEPHVNKSLTDSFGLNGKKL